MNVHVNVMAMHEREDLYNAVAPRIGEHDVFWGELGKGIWWNAKRAWSTYPDDATHICVLQEDIAVCDDFRATLDAIVSEEPWRVITLCALGKFVAKVARGGHRWMRLPPWRPFGVGNVMPVAEAERWLEWCRINVPDGVPGRENSDDGRLGDWLTTTQRLLYAPVPSPIQHVGMGRSLVGHDNFARNKMTTSDHIPEGISGLSLDWTVPFVYDTMTHTTYRREGK